MSTPGHLILKGYEEEVEKESNTKISLKVASQNPDGLEAIAPKNSSSIQEDRLEEKEDLEANIVKEEKCVETSVSSMESEKPCLSAGASTTAVADDDEGFKTPTSSDHQIPVVAQCPPAPRKPRPKPDPPAMKRKLSPSRTRRALFRDLSDEVESMFPLQIQDDDDVDRKIKKARTDGHDSSK